MKKWNKREQGITWWRDVSGPKRYIKMLAENVRMGIDVFAIMGLADECFLTVFKDRLNSFNCNFHYEEVDTADYPTQDAFVSYLEALAPGWRMDPLSPFASLANQGYLESFVLIITIQPESVGWMVDAIREFSNNSNGNSGIFIGVLPQGVSVKGIKKRLSIFDLEDYISIFDVQYFALQCLEDARMNEQQRYYTASLAAKIAGYNGIRCAQLSTRYLYEDPRGFLEEESGEDDITTEQLQNASWLDEAIWEAQMQSVLPITERIRRYIVEKYDGVIRKYLPTQDEYGKILNNPTDMELRHLQHYLKPSESKIFSEDDLKSFLCAYNVRNDLSHLKCLDVAKLDEILQ